MSYIITSVVDSHSANFEEPVAHYVDHVVLYLRNCCRCLPGRDTPVNDRECDPEALARNPVDYIYEKGYRHDHYTKRMPLMKDQIYYCEETTIY